MADWYKKFKQGIPAKTLFKKSSSEDVARKCPKCSQKIQKDALAKNFFSCHCGYHFRISSAEYFDFLFDNSQSVELFSYLSLQDERDFQDIIPYPERILIAKNKSGVKESISIAQGKLFSIEVIIAVMDFSFIGGTLGTVMGEKLSKAIEKCIHGRIPLIVISRSGGARLMESIFALMQMTKISARLNELTEAGIPFISVMTDPTIGGVTAAVGMRGDINIAEPNALIAYTAPKVLRESIGKEPPKGFQRSEFVFDNGFIDLIVSRDLLKGHIANFLTLVLNENSVTERTIAQT